MAVLAIVAAVAAMFAATPYLIGAVAVRYGVSEGTSGLLSAVQVGAFATMTLTLPRLVTPSTGKLRVAAAVFLAANLVSIAMWWFPLLVAVRAVAGAAAGTLTWMVWREAMSARRAMASISSVGPLSVLIAAPLLAYLSGFGDRAVYAVLAVASIPGLFAAVGEATTPAARRIVSRSRSNRVLLGALFLLTFAGAGMFVYESVAAVEVLGLTTLQTSLGFSLNAAGGLLGARLAGRHKRPGWWLASAGPAIFLTIGSGTPWLFFPAMAWWGFAFWMGVPGVLQMIAARSLHPAERAGDTQGFMAIGRAVGPFMGGFFTDAGAFTALAAVAGTGVSLSGAVVIGVQEGRERLPPTTPLKPAGP